MKYRKVTFLTSLGAGLEYYDFVIYALLASLLSRVYFPQNTAGTALIETFAIFAVGYLVRPIGGIIFGHIGDKYGRKKTFTLSILIMALATLGIALLPGYNTIGILAPALLLLLRIIQGMAYGAELPGALTFLSEHVDDHHRGLHCGILFGCVGLGAFFGSMMSYAITHSFSEQALLTYGWRIPFLLGSFLAIAGYFIRRHTQETPLFLKTSNADNHLPIKTVLMHQRKQLLKGVMVTTLAACLIIFGIYVPSYAHEYFGYTLNQAYLAVTIGLIWASCAMPIFGWICDKIGRKKLLMFALSANILLLYPIFLLLTHGSLLAFILFTLSFETIIAAISAAYVVMLPELFTTNTRYTGVAICYNVSFSIAGLLPSFLILLISQTQLPMIVPFLFIIMSIITTLALSAASFQSQLQANQHYKGEPV